ncbi:MAG: hypothetical protein RLZZ205_449 [Bacteroidota bacterium]|jgi:hypothetical protein
MKKYLLALVAIVWFSFAHQFHFSETLLEWNEKTFRVNCTIRVFTDDLEKEMELKYNIKNNDSANFEQHVFQYAKEVLQLKTAQGVSIDLLPIGMEREGDVMYLYMESDGLGDDEIEKRKLLNGTTKGEGWWFQQIQLKQAFFFDQFEDQKNLVNLRKDGKTQSYYFMGDIQQQLCTWP